MPPVKVILSSDISTLWLARICIAARSIFDCQSSRRARGLACDTPPNTASCVDCDTLSGAGLGVLMVDGVNGGSEDPMLGKEGAGLGAGEHSRGEILA